MWRFVHVHVHLPFEWSVKWETNICIKCICNERINSGSCKKVNSSPSTFILHSLLYHQISHQNGACGREHIHWVFKAISKSGVYLSKTWMGTQYCNKVVPLSFFNCIIVDARVLSAVTIHYSCPAVTSRCAVESSVQLFIEQMTMINENGHWQMTFVYTVCSCGRKRPQ